MRYRYCAPQIALLKIRAKQIMIHAKQGASLHPTSQDNLAPIVCYRTDAMHTERNGRCDLRATPRD
jgi:hypothetical protein